MSISDYSEGPPPVAVGARISPWERARRVFVSPSTAWEGLEEQVQWWVPMLIVGLVGAGVFALIYQRSFVPMVLDQLDQSVANGQLPAEKLDQIEGFYSGPMAMLLFGAMQVLTLSAMTFLWAAIAWFGVGFVLGGKFRYRLALEAVGWSGLVMIPSQIITAGIAWSLETLKGVHVGLAALLTMSDPPTKLQAGLAVFLDSISPFTAWNLFVLVLISSSLSRMPRRSVAWVLVSLYLAFAAICAAAIGIFAPGA